MLDLLEALMIICFGLSWPISIYRSYQSCTAKGKSLFFEVFLWIGYVFGIVRKFMEYSMGSNPGFLFYMGWAFYFLNIIEISIDMLLYFRNVKLDHLAEEAAAAVLGDAAVEEEAIEEVVRNELK